MWIRDIPPAGYYVLKQSVVGPVQSMIVGDDGVDDRPGGAGRRVING
jgi:hypothetical protein